MKSKHEITALRQAETERRQIEEELLESHHLLDAIQRLAKIGGWEWDLAQQTMTWTDETYRIHGMTPGELAAGSPEHTERSLACYDPDDRPVIAAAFQRCVDEGRSYDLEFPFTSHDGRRLWIRTVARPLIKGDQVVKVIGNIIDITERKRVEQQLELTQFSTDEAALGIFWVDAEDRFLYANAQACRSLGYSLAELRNMRVWDIDPEFPESMSKPFWQDIRQTKVAHFESTHRRKDGSTFPVELSIRYAEYQGKEYNFAFVQDITRRQRSEALLKARLELSGMAMVASLDEILRAALDLAERFTSSQVGFFHFVDADQEHLTLQTWSTNTLKHLCTFPGKGLHYPLSLAGVWADCLRQHQPVIYNDYASLPHRRDLPEGHAPVVRVLTVPIQRGEREVAVIGLGNKPEDYTEDDIASVQELTHLLMDIIERKQAEERIAHLAYHDVLTELPNRTLLTDRLRQSMAQAQRDQRRLAMCFLDLDDFKPINDAWGHAEGDRVLVEVAHRLKACVRAGDTVARLGGDEFVLLLGDLGSVEECESALDRVLTALQTPFSMAGPALSLTASIGVTLYPDDSVDPDALLRHVDQAMYAAKQSGGNRYQWFDTEFDRCAREYRAILQQVEAGLAAGEFQLYYQPKVDMRTGVVIGAEALIRWQHPREGLLTPARFIPPVENSDLAIVLDRWVLGEALRQMSIWASQGLALPVSVNLSARYLQQPHLMTHLSALLAEHPSLPTDRLELEILETTALEDLQAISTLLVDCRQLGMRFALDDFGTGYSSLTYLRKLPVHVLKIDQSFVRDALTDGEARAIVEGVIGLSRAFRRVVIAEGVETVAHGCLLLALGCDLAQGYGIARPMPPEQIPAWIAGWTPPDAWIDQAGPD